MGARHRFSGLVALVASVVLAIAAIAPVAAQAPSDTYGPVGDETLWSIARKVGVGRAGTTAQIAWALYRTNPEAFEGSPTKVRRGATLKIPATAVVNQVPAAQAYAFLTGQATPPAAGSTAPPIATPVLVTAPVAAQLPPPTVIETAVPAAVFARSVDEQTARSLAPQGADAVYRHLEPLEEKYAGDVDYDYQLGTSALDSGRFSQAILVLQRAVATQPGYAGARMELGRAYYAQGDNESARREFETLAKDDPPAEAKRAIADYLAAIDRRAAVYERQVTGYAELGTGFDSNANGATDAQSFLGFQLDDRNVSTESSYYQLSGGGQASYPLRPAWRLQGSGSASYRANPDASFVDSQMLRLGGGVEWRPNQLEFALGPNLAWAMLDGEDNHQVLGIDGAATWRAPRAQTSFNLRSAQTRYADGLEVLDVDTLLYGLAAQYTTLTLPRCVLMAAVTLGSDDAVEAGSQFGRDMEGARAGAIVDFGRGHALLASVAALNSDYDGTFFGISREDRQFSANLGYEWGGLRPLGWTLRGQFGYVDNASSVSLYEYDRYDFGVSVRKEFR